MSKTITILNPQIISRGKELILIPREEYEALRRVKMKKIAEILLNARQKRAISQSEKELRKGSYFTLYELKKYLERSYSKTRR